MKKNFALTVSVFVLAVMFAACSSGGGGGGFFPVNGGGKHQSNPSPVHPRFAYVVNNADDTISIYTVNAQTGRLRHNGYVATGAQPYSVTVHPSGKFAYATNRGDNTVSAYTINQTTGALAAVTSAPTATTGGYPQSVVVDPWGRFAYVANTFNGAGGNSISQYMIGGDGALISMTPPAIAAGLGPTSVVVDPSGRFAYAANYYSNDISAYSIDQTSGALISAGTATAGLKPNSLSIDPSGKFVYATNRDSGNISVYTINRSTGQLVSAGTVTVGDGFEVPFSVAVDPSGKHVYVSCTHTLVFQWEINPDGSLTPLTPDWVRMGITGTYHSITVDPSNKYAYAADSVQNMIWVLTIDSTTGALTAAGSISSRSAPYSLAMTGGASPVTYVPKFGYAANRNSNTISAYTINQTTGAFTAVTTAPTGIWPQSVTVDPSGKFAYAANTGSGNISVYTIEQTTGALISQGTASAGNGPDSVVVDPSGRLAYAANYYSDSISQYFIGPDGALISMDTPTVAAGDGPSSITFDPSGRFVYAANTLSDNISVYSIHQKTGVLISQGTVTAGDGPCSVAVDPSGKFVYAANLSGSISAYTIDQTTGTLYDVSGSPFAVGTDLRSVTVDPSGTYVYVVDRTLPFSNIRVLTINQTTGALSIFTSAGSGTDTRSVTVDPSGKFVYAGNYGSGNNISAYAIDKDTGFLTGVSGAPFAAGTGPYSITTTGAIQ